MRTEKDIVLSRLRDVKANVEVGLDRMTLEALLYDLDKIKEYVEKT